MTCHSCFLEKEHRSYLPYPCSFIEWVLKALRWNPSSSQCALFICYSYIDRITLTLCFVLCALFTKKQLFVCPCITKLLERITGFTQIAGFGIRLFRLELYWELTDWRLFTQAQVGEKIATFLKMYLLVQCVCVCLCPWQDFGWGLSWTSRAERMTDQLEEYDTSAVLRNTESLPHPHEFRGKCAVENLWPIES